MLIVIIMKYLYQRWILCSLYISEFLYFHYMCFLWNEKIWSFTCLLKTLISLFHEGKWAALWISCWPHHLKMAVAPAWCWQYVFSPCQTCWNWDHCKDICHLALRLPTSDSELDIIRERICLLLSLGCLPEPFGSLGLP